MTVTELFHTMKNTTSAIILVQLNISLTHSLADFNQEAKNRAFDVVLMLFNVSCSIVSLTENELVLLSRKVIIKSSSKNKHFDGDN